jgi:hypothetical protein
MGGQSWQDSPEPERVAIAGKYGNMVINMAPKQSLLKLNILSYGNNRYVAEKRKFRLLYFN